MKKIESLWAWVTPDTDYSEGKAEGIIGFSSHLGVAPAVSGDYPTAKFMGEMLINKPDDAKLVEFRRVED